MSAPSIFSPTVRAVAAQALASEAGLPLLSSALTPVLPAPSIPSAANDAPRIPSAVPSAAQVLDFARRAEDDPEIANETIVVAKIKPDSDDVTIGGGETRVGYSDAFDVISANNARVVRQLEATQSELREQSKGWYRNSAYAAIFGVCIIGVAVVITAFGYVSAGILTTVSSIIVDVVAALFFRESRRADKRVDDAAARLNELRRANSILTFVETIDNPQSRDKMKMELVRTLLGTTQLATP